MNFLLLSSESNTISFEQSWRHFLCTFSNFSMSCLYQGFHIGDAYSRAGLIIDWYNVVTFFSVKFVKHRFIIPFFWCAFFVIISMCVAGLRVLDIVTPKSFWLSTLSRFTPSRVFIYLLASRIVKTKHFKALKFINQIFDHAKNSFKSSWRMSQSLIYFICRYSLVSSAKSLAVDDAMLGRSFTKMRKSKGPNI